MHYDPAIDGYTLSRWVWEERLEQVREINGERAYEKMRRTVKRASRPLSLSQFPSREGPERCGPERDYARAARSFSRVLALLVVGLVDERAEMAT